jgi:hypothetical protein
MSPLGALSQAWVSAEASLPRGGEIAGVWRFGEEWIALSEGPDRDYLDASARYPDQALRRLADALRERARTDYRRMIARAAPHQWTGICAAVTV